MGFVEDDDFIKCIQSFNACEHLFIRFGNPPTNYKIDMPVKMESEIGCHASIIKVA